MRLLFVTHMLPYPPTDGGRIATLNAIRHLSRRHEVYLASLAAPGEERHATALRQWCAGLEMVPGERWRRFARLPRAIAGGIPGTASFYYDARLAEAVRRLAHRHAAELVVLEHLNTAAYRAHAAAPVVLREHNVEYKVWERQAEHTANPLWRSVLRTAARRIRHYEARAAGQCARCLAISRADQDLLRDIAPRARVEVIPAGIDCDYFSPCAAASEREVPFSMVVVGSFAWKPKRHNLEAIAALFPRIRAALPGARFTVVGKGIPPGLRRRIAARGIEVAGEVDDVRPYLQRAALVLNYVEVGGGIALKVLEALAMRRPVLSNALGCEGLELAPGRDLCVADTVEQFVLAARRLLCDRAERDHLAQHGHRRVLESYSCDAAGALYEQVFAEVLQDSRRPAAARVARPA